MPATFYVGDAIEVMGKLPENSVDLILTSPPFLALRSYLPADHPDKGKEGGSQSTPGEFIDWLLDVAEACARVLAPHGSLCIELGDTYSGGETSGGFQEVASREQRPEREGTGADGGARFVPTHGGSGWPLAKSLSLIPESFRWAMVYGRNPFTGRTTEPWRLRNVIRWVRPNPPVGALGDKFRPATSELMVFCKSAKRYFDLDAVRSPYTEGTLSQYKADPDDPIGSQRPTTVGPKELHIGWKKGQALLTHPAGAPPLDWWNIPLLEGEEETRYGPKPRIDTGERVKTLSSVNNPKRGDYLQGIGEWKGPNNPLGAPPLDWWEIPPGGYEGAHYAVFPPELCVKPVKAMSPERVCKTCGEPSRRIVGEAEYVTGNGLRHSGNEWTSGISEGKAAHSNKPDGNTTRVAPTLGFSDCGHDDWRPGLVLDPFGGSGTTALVATGHGRDCILIDLDSRNFDLALERVGPFILSLGNFDD